MKGGKISIKLKKMVDLGQYTNYSLLKIVAYLFFYVKFPVQPTALNFAAGWTVTLMSCVKQSKEK